MEHLFKIGLENFRLFKDNVNFDFAPITLLTGVNNSGKSSLIKALLLLKDSFAKSPNLSSLLFTEGGKHNLGTFEKVKNRESKDDYIKFSLKIPNNTIEENLYFDLTYIPNKFRENGILKSFKIYTVNEILIDFNPSIKIDEITNNKEVINDYCASDIKLLKINLEYFINILKNNIQKAKQEGKRNSDNSPIDNFDLKDITFVSDSSVIAKSIIDSNSAFNSFYKQKTPRIEHNDLINLNIDNPIFLLKDKLKDEILSNDEFNIRQKKVLEEIKTKGYPIFTDDIFSNYLPDSTLDWYFHVINSNRPNINLKTKDKECVMSDIGEYIFNEFLNKNIKSSIKELRRVFSNIYTLSSIRGNTERLYYNTSNVADINNIIIHFLELNISESLQIYNFINTSLKLFGIGEKIIIKRTQGVASEIFIDNEQNLLADLGFGFTQLIPILLKIAIIAKENENADDNYPSTFSPSILLLEEPESNLHPSFQSKLADLIIDATKKFNIQFILETHSEYFIRKLQYLTARNEISTEHSVIYYFHEQKADNNEYIRKINILEDGSLSKEFGTGFYDEATNWKFELVRLKNTQRN